jgi:hypothetical protein
MANGATLRYVRAVALPCATYHGVELHELRKARRNGTVETLHGRLVQPGSRSLPILVRTSATGAPGTRCLEGHHWHFQESLEAIRGREPDAGRQPQARSHAFHVPFGGAPAPGIPPGQAVSYPVVENVPSWIVWLALSATASTSNL